MEKEEIGGLDFVIDKLTKSIENVISGDSFPTEISPVTVRDLKNVTKINKWLFDWRLERKQAKKQVYKLTIIGNPNIIKGLICIEIKTDHVYIHLLENAPFNKGKDKVYAGVAGNLLSYACYRSFEEGFEGNVSFLSKSQLINHYTKTLGAFHFGGRIMIIETKAALKLVNHYFKNIL